MGYSVSSIQQESIKESPQTDLTRVLSGKAAGINITTQNGLSGSSNKVIIRGTNSFTGDNNALYVIDGVPISNDTNASGDFVDGNMGSSRSFDIDPNNIERVDILKGLAATTLYGTQGRNGVILITTKGGSKKDANKKFEITFSQSVYATQINNLAEYQNLYGQGSDNVPNPGFVGNWGGRFDAGLLIDHPYADQGDIFPEFEDLEIPYEAAENNVKDFFRTGLGHATNVNVSGSPGQGGSKYNLNFGYTTEDGYIRNNGLTRYNLGVGGSTKLANNFSVSGTANYSNLRVNTPPIAANNAAGALSIFTRTLFIPRNLDLNNLPFENPIDNSSVYYRGDQENPYWLLNYAGTSRSTTVSSVTSL